MSTESKKILHSRHIVITMNNKTKVFLIILICISHSHPCNRVVGFRTDDIGTIATAQATAVQAGKRACG
jgi:hypothetical protein